MTIFVIAKYRIIIVSGVLLLLQVRLVVWIVPFRLLLTHAW